MSQPGTLNSTVEVHLRSCGPCGLILLAVAVVGVCPFRARAEDRSQALFRRVFGDAARLDPAMIARVKAARPGERIFVDRNGDGRNDECWYIDTSPRHTAQARPLLVRAIDEDGDLDAMHGPDLDNDLYVADMKADGTVDSIIDYQDRGGDNSLHEMAFYFYMPHHPFFGDDVLRVWWGRDDGGDHLLWYDVNYNYDQSLCQYRCHFSGEETFVAFGLNSEGTEWLSAFENPFLFYDPDHDRCSEVVLRIEGQGDKVRAVRYSFDADDDAWGRRTHDYDFSITAVAEPDHPVQLPPGVLESTKLRGLPTQGWLNRDKARPFVAEAAWARALLTWDEMNANTEQDLARDPHERWEGVIAHGTKDFKQVGGPPCSTLNKRNELSRRPASPMALYYDASDRKLHLRGADEGWLLVDFDFDGKADASYGYTDENGDGIFDRRRIDVDNDGRNEFEFPMRSASTQAVMLEWRRLMPFYKLSLPRINQESQAFIDAVRAALPEAPADPAAVYFTTQLQGWMPATHLGEYIRKSPAGARFYLDLIRDRAAARLKAAWGDKPAWAEVERLYAQGSYEQAAGAVARLAGKPAPRITAFEGFARRLAVRIENAGGQPRMDWPVAIPVADIRKAAPDFNPANCAVTAGDRWIEWREIPHQVDEADSTVGPELTFLADLPGTGSVTLYLYYSPEGRRDKLFPRRTGTAEDWVPPNIGWESNRCAYRAYWGQFDFFGKKTDDLVYDNIGAKSYHGEVEWGIDALHVGTASGLGGLTLYQGDEAFLVQNPAGKGEVKFVKRQLVKGPVRAVIDITASNIVPGKPDLSVRMICTSYAERQETQVKAVVTGADGEVVLAPGLVKLAREASFQEPGKGLLGSWGWQEDAIGDIGMAVMVRPLSAAGVVDLPAERRIRCRTQGGRLDYWLIGDWRRGRQHPIAPDINNWKQEVSELALLLTTPVGIKLGTAEAVSR